MRIAVNRKSRGFTLIEVLVAICILVIGMLAVLSALVTTMEQNLNNLSMDEAVRIAEQQMNQLRNTSFTGLTNGNLPIARNFRNFTRTFNVVWTVTNLSASSKTIQVVVSWTHKGILHQHSVTSIMSSEL
jgi:prepilin-type N-terminal cleavage/methylation domain-containing protein